MKAQNEKNFLTNFSIKLSLISSLIPRAAQGLVLTLFVGLLPSSTQAMCAAVFSKIDSAASSETPAASVKGLDQAASDEAVEYLINQIKKSLLKVADAGPNDSLSSSQEEYINRLRQYISENGSDIKKLFKIVMPNPSSENAESTDPWMLPVVVSLSQLNAEALKLNLPANNIERFKKNLQLALSLVRHDRVNKRTLFYFLGPGLLGKHRNNLMAVTDSALSPADKQEKLDQFWKAFEELNYLQAHLELYPNHRLYLPVEFHIKSNDQLPPSYDIVGVPTRYSNNEEIPLRESGVVLISGKEPVITKPEKAREAIKKITLSAIADMNKSNGDRSRGVLRTNGIDGDVPFSELFFVSLSLQIDFDGLSLDPKRVADELSLDLKNNRTANAIGSRLNISLIDKSGGVRAVILNAQDLKSKPDEELSEVESEFMSLLNERPWVWLEDVSFVDELGTTISIRRQNVLDFVNYVHHSQGFLQSIVGKALGEIKTRLNEIDKSEPKKAGRDQSSHAARSWERSVLVEKQDKLKVFLSKMRGNDFGNDPADFRIDGQHIIDFLDPGSSSQRRDPDTDLLSPTWFVENDLDLSNQLNKAF